MPQRQDAIRIPINRCSQIVRIMERVLKEDLVYFDKTCLCTKCAKVYGRELHSNHISYILSYLHSQRFSGLPRSHTNKQSFCILALCNMVISGKQNGTEHKQQMEEQKEFKT